MALIKTPDEGFYFDDSQFDVDYKENLVTLIDGGSAGPQGHAGQAATIQIGSVTSGDAPAVTNSGAETEAVLDFVLQQGPQGPQGEQGPQGPAGPSKQGVAVPDVSGSEAADAITTINALLASLRDAGLIANS